MPGAGVEAPVTMRDKDSGSGCWEPFLDGPKVEIRFTGFEK
jgi:hypothetical protein